MLDCRKDRIDYGEILMPPSDYRFDYGIATTYSLDLETLLSIPIALVYGQSLEGDFSRGDARLLDAVRQFGNKVKIFHEKGGIKVPSAFNHLYAFMENALAGILLDTPYSAFHPKIWVVRYKHKDNGPAFFRILVLSRNMTFDRSWDVAGFLEGTAGTRSRKANAPLCDFIRWLDRQSPIPAVEAFLQGLEQTDFAPPEGFADFSFHPVGIPGYAENPVMRQTARDSLALSPFVHQKTLSRLHHNTRRRFAFFGEEHELRQLPSSLLSQFPVYCLPEVIVDGERMADAEDGTGMPCSQHLHAKLFLFETPQQTRWFLGSANATEAAAQRNIEFLLELSGTDNRIGFKRILEELNGKNEEEGPFLRFHPDSADKDDDEERKREQELCRLIHALLSAPLEATLTSSRQERMHDLEVSLDLRKIPPIPGYKISLAPFGSQRRPEVVSCGQFTRNVLEGINEPTISRFLRFRVEFEGESVRDFLVKMDISGIPDTRMDSVFHQLVRNSRDFFNHLQFLLATEVRKEALADFINLTKSRTATAGSAPLSFDSPMFEQLLLAASREPEKLHAVDEVVNRLKDAVDEETNLPVVPPEFLSFWENFRFHAAPRKANR